MSELLEIAKGFLGANQFASGGLLLMALGGAVHYMRAVPGRIYNHIKGYLFIELDISDRDQAFFWMDRWLSEHEYGRRSRRLTVSSAEDHENGGKPLIFLSPAPGWHFFLFRGRLVSLKRDRTRSQNSNGSTDSSETGTGVSQLHKGFQEEFSIRIFSRDRLLAVSLIEAARDLCVKKTEDMVSLLKYSGFDEWHSSTKVRRRDFGSVIMKAGTVEHLTADITQFLKRKQWYVERGIPYRRGYLLHGTPGNGKSSMILAAASHFRLSIATICMSDTRIDDTGLARMISDIPANTILLMEDIDCIFRKRDSENAGRITFSGLLNALDGVGAGEGRLLFMTTNHPELLDAALIRPGRADVHIEVGLPDRDQLRRMFLRFFPEHNELAGQFSEVAPVTVCMAAIQGHLLRYSDDPHAAVRLAGGISADSVQT